MHNGLSQTFSHLIVQIVAHVETCRTAKGLDTLVLIFEVDSDENVWDSKGRFNHCGDPIQAQWTGEFGVLFKYRCC